MYTKLTRLAELLRTLKVRRRPCSLNVLANELDVNERTVRRYIRELSDGFFAPIIKKDSGYMLDESQGKFELPGVWLNNQELMGFATIMKVLDDISPSDEDKDLSSIKQAINVLLQKRKVTPARFYNAIKLIPSHKQAHNNKAFNQLSEAILLNKRVVLDYLDSRQQATQREISPLQLVNYQHNWYVDAYCHLRRALRQFRLNRIQMIATINKTAALITEAEHKQHFTSAYGIFAGKATRTVTLRFFDDAAREVSQQQWHPQQVGEWHDTDYLLSFPYNKDAELVRDILKYANNVEVVSPSKLRNKVARIAKYMVEIYAG